MEQPLSGKDSSRRANDGGGEESRKQGSAVCVLHDEVFA